MILEKNITHVHTNTQKRKKKKEYTCVITYDHNVQEENPQGLQTAVHFSRPRAMAVTGCPNYIQSRDKLHGWEVCRLKLRGAKRRPSSNSHYFTRTGQTKQTVLFRHVKWCYCQHENLYSYTYMYVLITKHH